MTGKEKTSIDIIREWYPNLEEQLQEGDLEFMLETHDWLSQPASARPKWIPWDKAQSRFALEGGKRLFVYGNGVTLPEYPDADGLPSWKQWNGSYFQSDKFLAVGLIALEKLRDTGETPSDFEQSQIDRLEHVRYDGEDMEDGVDVEVRLFVDTRHADSEPRKASKSRIKVARQTEERHHYIMKIGDPDVEHARAQRLERFLFRPKK